MTKKKEIALVDCNNFFVGCEQAMNPSLLNKAVCVVGGHNGCVLARSNEAKRLGVAMGLPYFMAKKDFPNVIYLQSNMGLYHEFSVRVREMLKNYSPIVEVYSIDEAFLDLTGIDKVFGLSYESLIARIRDEIKENIGINVSVGLANSKTLAKLATEKAKKGDFIYRIKSEDIRSELSGLLAQSIWGIGRNTASSLRKYGIFTALDIVSKDDDFYKRNFGKKGLELKHELLGESVIKTANSDQKPKSIQKTSAFPNFSRDKNYIRESLRYHLHNVCAKMRRLNLSAGAICVMLRTKDFRVFVERKELDTAKNCECELYSIINELFNRIYFEDLIYRASGIYVEKLVNTEVNQLGLFQTEINHKAEKISALWDKFEAKYGKNVFNVGAIPKKDALYKLKRIEN